MSHKRERKKPVMTDGRRSMVIYRKWIVNGFRCEMDSPARLLEFAAMAIGTLGLADKKWLVLSTDLLGHDVEPRQAMLELLDPDDIASRVSEHLCVCIKVDAGRKL